MNMMLSHFEQIMELMKGCLEVIIFMGILFGVLAAFESKKDKLQKFLFGFTFGAFLVMAFFSILWLVNDTILNRINSDFLYIGDSIFIIIFGVALFFGIVAKLIKDD